ncbi:hypothetical protein M8J75_006051 [Diaphorina citri]|nr:hypothetical protein M8J75_006051 [Diaphorina citri]
MDYNEKAYYGPAYGSRPRASGEWKQQLNLLDEGDLFMELIKDISNELDIDVLCHKILVNVGLLTRADRGSLFLAKGSADNRYLVAKLFDVTVDTVIIKKQEENKKKEEKKEEEEGGGEEEAEGGGGGGGEEEEEEREARGGGEEEEREVRGGDY